MSNIISNFNQNEKRLSVTYETIAKKHEFSLCGEFSEDNQTFFANPEGIDNCDDLSPTEKTGIKKYVMSERQRTPKIVFKNRRNGL